MLTRVETQAVSVARAPIPAPVSAPASAPEPEPPASPALPSAVVAAAPELDPIDARYPLHGVAFHVLAQVYSEPSDKAEVIGYLRRGGTLRAKPGVKGRGCNTRWHELLGGGFVCAGRGFQLGTTPQTFTPSPAAPALQDDLPYAYEKTLGRDVPQYVHLPSEREERDTSAQLAQMKSATVAQASDLERKRESVELSAKAASTSKAPEATDEPQLPSLVRMVMQPGFYVSVDGHEQDGARSLTRTVRGAYVRTEAMTPVPVPRMHGVSLSGSDAFPLALNFHPASASYRRDASTGVLVRADTLSLMQAFSLTGQSLIQNGQRYLLARDGTWLREDGMRVVTAAQRPPYVPARARWIDITLSTQTLVAYEGATPVFATLVSTGKEGHDTPTGIFRIQSKHVSATMDGEAGSDEAYSIEDVPWTMYFQGNYALHAAFWHKQFGRVRSHGCVNLAPADARRLFEWATPTLPNGFHGAVATRENPGTFVVIHQ